MNQKVTFSLFYRSTNSCCNLNFLPFDQREANDSDKTKVAAVGHWLLPLITHTELIRSNSHSHTNKSGPHVV